MRKWQSSRCRFQKWNVVCVHVWRVSRRLAVGASPQRPFSFTLRNELRPLMQTSTQLHSVLSIPRKNKHGSKQLPYFPPCCLLDRGTTRRNALFSSVRTKMFFLSFKMEEHKVPLQHPPEPWLFRDVRSCYNNRKIRKKKKTSRHGNWLHNRTVVSQQHGVTGKRRFARPL